MAEEEESVENPVHLAECETELEENQFSPLIIDLSPRCQNSRYMLRKNILPGQYPIIYELQ